MTKLDFPDTPSTGQQYGSSGTVWRWDGTRWGSTAGAAGARGCVAYAQITVPQSGILATSVNVNGLSVTWTADPSRRYRTSVQYSAWSGIADDDIMVSITDPAGNVKAIKGDTSVSPSISTSYYVAAVETGLSGSITRKVIARRGAGSGGITIDADPTYPAYIMVEDITYEAGSANPYIDVASLPKGKVAANTWATDQGGFTNTYADISGSTLNHNFVAGRFYRYSFILPTAQATANAQQSFRVVGQSMADLSPFTATAIVGYQNTWVSWVQFSPNSSYNGNIWMRGYTSAGTMSINSGNVIRSQFLLEDLGLN